MKLPPPIKRLRKVSLHIYGQIRYLFELNFSNTIEEDLRMSLVLPSIIIIKNQSREAIKFRNSISTGN
jgi:hypothetical protein